MVTYKKSHIGYIWHICIVTTFLLIAFMPWQSWITSKIDLANFLTPPTWKHPLGTDNLGRDFLVRIQETINTAIVPIWLITIFSSLLGILISIYIIVLKQGNKVLTLPIQLFNFINIFIASIPIGIITFFWASIHEKAGLTPVLIALAFLFTIRGYLSTLNLYNHDCKLGFWQANSLLGGTVHHRIWNYGILGHWREHLVKILSFNLKIAITIEASLSYLGFGIQEPNPSFGNMLASHFDLYLKGYYHTLIVLLAALLITCLFPSSFTFLVKNLLNQNFKKRAGQDKIRRLIQISARNI